MMGSDARDMLGLPSAAPPKPTLPKAPKPKVRGPTGMSREVMDLNYEGAPPISIVAPKFKEKPKLPFKPRAWEETPFGNSARKDGLILKHWRRKGDAANVGQLPVTPADSNAASEMDQDDKGATIPDAHWAKYNVRIPRPQYSDEEYETHLKSEDWSKDETDYLVDLAIDFDLRWIVISDRYDYHPSNAHREHEDMMALTPQIKPRSQEDIKSRYYTVAAKAMSLHVGVQNMSAAEFEMHEKMLKFSPTQETKRKAYVEQLLARTEEEKHEEEFLLKELSRIVINQEKLNNERKALYERLEAPKTAHNENYNTTMYQTSQGLTQLMQNMLSQNKQKDAQRKEKRQSGLPEEQDRHRTAQADHNKRGSIGGGAQAANHHRHLNPRDQVRYGVTYPTTERLVGGVTFRNERAMKAAQAKSSVQTTRISAALTELGIPVRLTMPTARVVSEYERLIDSVKGLLEVRKLREKVDGEVRVWKAQKEAAEARERGEEVEEKKEEEPKVEEEEEDNQEEQAKKKDDSDDDEEGQEESRNQEEEDDEEENGQADGTQNGLANEEEGEGEADADANDNDDAANEDDEEQEEDADGEEDDAEAEADDEEVNAEVAELEDEDEEEEEEEGGGGDAEAEEDGENGGEGAEEEEELDVEEEEDEAEENNDEPSPAPTARSTRKRSASVASGISSKRQKK